MARSRPRVRPFKAIGEGFALAGTALTALLAFFLPKLKTQHARAAESDLELCEPELLETAAPYPVED